MNTYKPINLAYQTTDFPRFFTGAGDKPGCGIRDSFGASQLLDRSLCRKLLYARR